jgi:hypothetical protein
MKNQHNRRTFVRTGTIACCSLLLTRNFPVCASSSIRENDTPDPLKMNYCGYTCPEDCKFLVASIKNDPVLKKEAYDIWEMKDRFGVETFEADKIFCFGCKNIEKPVGIRLQKCDVRACAIEKKLDACIECDELSSCEKDLFKKFPDFHQSVIKLQAVYEAASN